MKKVLLIALSAALCVSAAMAQTSVKALEKQAGNGDTGAMVAAGDAYFKGDGTGKDVKKAEKWYKKAIDKGNITAYERMADLYRSWDGIEKNPKKVSEWAVKGGLKGNPRLALEAANGFINNEEGYSQGDRDYNMKTTDKHLHVAADSGSVEAADKAIAVGLSIGNQLGAISAMERYIALGGDANANENVRMIKGLIAERGNADTYQQLLNTCLDWNQKTNYNQQPSTINNARRGMFSDEYINNWKKYYPVLQKGDFKSMRDAAGLPIFFEALWLAQNGKKEEAEKEVEKLKLTGGLYPQNLTKMYMVYRVMGENDAVRFFDRVLTEDSEAVAAWLSDRNATKMLTWDRADLQHKLQFALERNRSGFGKYPEMLFNLLPPAIPQSEIDSMLKVAQR